jgi:predicted transcriptional regulator
MPALLLSLKPKFASAIYSGIKRVEFRRVSPRCEVPIEAFIYETMPVGLVTGMVRVKEIVVAPEEALFALAKDDPMLEDYRRYLAGAHNPCGLVLGGIERFASPRALAGLIGRGARAPQSWCYVNGPNPQQSFRPS